MRQERKRPAGDMDAAEEADAQPAPKTPRVEPQGLSAQRPPRDEKARAALLAAAKADAASHAGAYARSCQQAEEQHSQQPPALSLPLKDAEVASLVEGTRLPLGRLVAFLIGAAARSHGAAPDSCPSEQHVRNLVLRLANRKSMGGGGPEVDQVDRLENAEERFLWRWELHALTTLAPKARPAAKAARDTWSKTSKRLGAVTALATALEAAAANGGDDAPIAAAAVVEIRAALAKLAKVENAKALGAGVVM